jgi:hypothetical protein
MSHTFARRKLFHHKKEKFGANNELAKVAG